MENNHFIIELDLQDREYVNVKIEEADNSNVEITFGK